MIVEKTGEKKMQAGAADSGKPKSAAKTLPIGAVISEPGSTMRTKTGGWRSFRPVLAQPKCKRCGRCWLVCPEAAIHRKDDGSYEIDYDYCKGCLLCARECPFKAIEKEVEEK